MHNDDYFDPFDRRATITFAGVVVASCAWFLLATGIYRLLGGTLWSLQLLQRGTIARISPSLVSIAGNRRIGAVSPRPKKSLYQAKTYLQQ
jgi:hypothetical protein